MSEDLEEPACGVPIMLASSPVHILLRRSSPSRWCNVDARRLWFAVVRYPEALVKRKSSTITHTWGVFYVLETRPTRILLVNYV
jgi:hypothetical protein